MLGAGRAKKSDPIDPAVGLVMKVRCGDHVSLSDTLCTLYVNDETRLEEVKKLLLGAIEISPLAAEKKPMIYGIITEKDV